jgi:hypothetical protein
MRRPRRYYRRPTDAAGLHQLGSDQPARFEVQSYHPNQIDQRWTTQRFVEEERDAREFRSAAEADNDLLAGETGTAWRVVDREARYEVQTYDPYRDDDQWLPTRFYSSADDAERSLAYFRAMFARSRRKTAWGVEHRLIDHAAEPHQGPIFVQEFADRGVSGFLVLIGDTTFYLWTEQGPDNDWQNTAYENHGFNHWRGPLGVALQAYDNYPNVGVAAQVKAAVRMTLAESGRPGLTPDESLLCSVDAHEHDSGVTVVDMDESDPIVVEGYESKEPFTCGSCQRPIRVPLGLEIGHYRTCPARPV